MQANNIKLSDEALMKLIQIGEDSAFDILYHRYAASLQLFFCRMLSSRELSEDAVHDLFLKVLTKSKTFDTNRNFKSWLYSIAHNQCKNIYAKNQVRLNGVRQINQETPSSENSKIELQLDRETFAEALNSKLKSIDTENRSVFILRFQEGLSIKEIATILNCPEGTVKSKLHYTLKDLARKLNVYKKI